MYTTVIAKTQVIVQMCLTEVGTGSEMGAGWGLESVGMVGAEKPEEFMVTEITGITIKWDKMWP